MAIICRHYSEMDECAGVLRQRGLPHQVRKGAGSFDPAADTIKVLTMHASKGLEFPVVALVGAGHMPAPGEDEREEAKLFYVGATRATQRLIIGVGGAGAVWLSAVMLCVATDGKRSPTKISVNSDALHHDWQVPVLESCSTPVSHCQS